MQIKDVVNLLEELSPIFYAESYDNVGLIVGDYNEALSGILITHDSLPEIVDEAIKKGLNMIVSFHPIVFSGLKKFTGKNYVEKAVIKAIKNDIAIYAIHTALDVSWQGVNDIVLKKLGAVNKEILIPKEKTIKKLSTYVPTAHLEELREALFEAGAGSIGNYDNCSFNIEGEGTYRGNEASNPVFGEKEVFHIEKEVNINISFPAHLESKILNTLNKTHPYEEIAYELTTLENKNQHIGLGMTGELQKPMSEKDFLNFLKEKLPTKCIRHSNLLGGEIKKIAVLGGSGSFATKAAIAANADVFISADFKYHDFYAAEDKIIIADIGHYESEQFIKNLLFEYLRKKITKFAVVLSEYNTNPINYL
ncbi:MAG: Nif3-like dinuclear metal center hexameric protein [Flavobacteriales bacterium]|nr:Nif3-like dinuclear metal center hexameric protein [Flavobacteriales bacterium]